jgi:small-conductance mechanosensitive channel/predicted HicB family RNase H-like nuclease
VTTTLLLTAASGVFWLAPVGEEQHGPPPSPVVQAPAPLPQVVQVKAPTPTPDSALQTRPVPEQLTDADRISRLQRSLEADRKELGFLQTQIKEPGGEYQKAEKEFRTLDSRLEEKKKEIDKAHSAADQAATEQLEAEVKALEGPWKSARERFNLAIQERKTQQEKAAALEQKIQFNQQALEKLTATPPRPGTTPPSKQGPSQPTLQPPDAQAASVTAPGSRVPASAVPPPLPAPAAAKGIVPPVFPGVSALPQPTAVAPPANERPASPEIVHAREDARRKQEVAKEARNKARSISERMETLRQNIELEQKLQETARQRADAAHQARAEREQELHKRLCEGAAPVEVARLQLRSTEAGQRFDQARADFRASTDRLTELQTELNDLQDEQIRALQEAEDRRQEADRAETTVHRLQNPFTLHNLLQWGLDHGPRMLLIVLSMLILQRLVGIMSRWIVNAMAHSSKRGTDHDRENRARTLVGVFRNTATLAILGGGCLLLFEEVGIPIGPLMGGAAVLGLAVAFGAQNLIRDYFSGFMVLLEDQYCINDVVRINDISGQVESITLRVTVLRDLEGVSHFIPHSTITHVSNMTHVWSRAFFEIGVGYQEDVDQVMEVLLELGRQLRQDAVFGPLILEDPEMLGVDGFGESAVLIKFFLKTRPLQQWPVRRELLRRIKHRFDELGIEIPFPHRTVYHRQATDNMGTPGKDRGSEKAA